MKKLLKLILTIVVLGISAYAINILTFLITVGLTFGLKKLGIQSDMIIFDALNSIVAIFATISILWMINKYILKNKLVSLFDQEISIGNILLCSAATVALISIIIIVYMSFDMGVFSWLSVSPWYIGTLSALSIAISYGFVEELVYRYFFYGYMSTKIGKFTASLICGLLFGAVHLNQITNSLDGLMLMLAAIGVTFLFVSIYELTGSIWYGAIVHTVWDVFTIENGFISPKR